MAYYCKACSYRGMKSGHLGECPACGSYDIVKDSAAAKEKTVPTKWRLVVLVLLWSCLAIMIIEKLVN